jgi:hypothetical protein
VDKYKTCHLHNQRLMEKYEFIFGRGFQALSRNAPGHVHSLLEGLTKQVEKLEKLRFHSPGLKSGAKESPDDQTGLNACH